MIETSKDLLFVVLALCILWLTIFLSWLLYYVIAIIRDAERIIRLVKGAAVKVDEVVSGLQDRLERSAGSFTLAAKALKEIVSWAIEQKMSKPSRSRKAKRSEEGEE